MEVTAQSRQTYHDLHVVPRRKIDIVVFVGSVHWKNLDETWDTQGKAKNTSNETARLLIEP